MLKLRELLLLMFSWVTVFCSDEVVLLVMMVVWIGRTILRRCF